MVSLKMKAAAVGVSLLMIISLVGIAMAYHQVPEGHEGVEKTWGAVNGNTLESGANLIVPVMQSVQNVETRPRTYTMSQTQGEGAKSQADAIAVKTVNGTTVKVDVTVRYRVNEEEADNFVQDWNNVGQMEQRLIRPTIRSDLRNEASNIQTSEIYTQEGREALTTTAQESLTEEFDGEPLVLEEVQVRNIDLPDEIDSTLDEKEQAKQQVQVEQEKVKQAEQRKKQRIVQAEADAEAIRIQGEALKNNKVVLEERYIQALKEGETIYVGESGVALTKETGETVEEAETNTTEN